MTTKESEIVHTYNLLRQKAFDFYKESRTLESLSTIEYCAKIGYNFLFKERLKDSEIESILVDIVSSQINKYDFPVHNGRLVFIDSFGLDNRGLTEQYLYALIELDLEFLFIITNDQFFKSSSNIISKVKNYHKGGYISVKSDFNHIERAEFILKEISSFRPEYLLIHPSPWDLVMIMVANTLKGNCKRLFINITDDHYWLGESAMDTIIEFRNFGYQFSKACRNIPESKIKLLPYFPIVQDEESFEGLPKEVEGMTIAISGGNGYKFLGKGDKYPSLVSRLLKENPKLILLLVGAKKGGEIVKSLCDSKVKNRILLIPPRKDIFQLIKRCDIFISSIPLPGGLMTQLAIKAGLPILGYAHKQIRTALISGVAPFVDSSYFDINSDDEFIEIGNRLIRDKNYRTEFAAKAKDSIIKKESFVLGFNDILDGGRPFQKYVSDIRGIENDTEEYQKLALETEVKYLNSFPKLLAEFKSDFFRKFGYSILEHMPASSIKKSNRSLSKRLKSRIKKTLLLVKKERSSPLYSEFRDLHFKHLGEQSIVGHNFFVKNPRYIEIGKKFSSMYNLRLEAWDSYAHQRFLPELKIGNNVSFNTDVHIGCINKVIIGDNVLFASRIYISDHSHGEIDEENLKIPPAKRELVSKGAVVIEDNVWVGEGVAILPNVTIGENSIVGANAVVTKSFPKNSIIAGNPAKVLKELD